MELRRQSDNSLISDKIYESTGWKEKYPNPVLETTNAVTYLQDRGRMEWINTVTFMFSDVLATSTLENMYTLKRLARRRQWLLFTDKQGAQYEVRVRGIPNDERDDESPLVEIRYLECALLMRGYE